MGTIINFSKKGVTTYPKVVNRILVLVKDALHLGLERGAFVDREDVVLDLLDVIDLVIIEGEKL